MTFRADVEDASQVRENGVKRSRRSPAAPPYYLLGLDRATDGRERTQRDSWRFRCCQEDAVGRAILQARLTAGLITEAICNPVRAGVKPTPPKPRVGDAHTDAAIVDDTI